MKVLFPASFIANCREQIVPVPVQWFLVCIHISRFEGKLALSSSKRSTPPQFSFYFSPPNIFHFPSTTSTRPPAPPHFYCFPSSSSSSYSSSFLLFLPSSFVPLLYGRCWLFQLFMPYSLTSERANIGPIVVEQWRGFYSWDKDKRSWRHRR